MVMMEDSSIRARQRHGWWYVSVGIASVLLPIVGGLAALCISRLRRFREGAPIPWRLALVWLAITVVQFVALFANFSFTSSVETIVG